MEEAASLSGLLQARIERLSRTRVYPWTRRAWELADDYYIVSYQRMRGGGTADTSGVINSYYERRATVMSTKGVLRSGYTQWSCSSFGPLNSALWTRGRELVGHCLSYCLSYHYR